MSFNLAYQLFTTAAKMGLGAAEFGITKTLFTRIIRGTSPVPLSFPNITPGKIGRAVAKAVLPEVYKAGINVTNFYNTLQSFGIGYRRSNVLADYRQAAKAIENKKIWDATRPAKRNIKDLLTPSVESLRTDYLYRYNVTVENTFTRQKYIRSVSIGYNRLYSEQTMEQKIIQKWDFWGYEADEELLDWELETVLYREGVL